MGLSGGGEGDKWGTPVIVSTIFQKGKYKLVGTEQPWGCKIQHGNRVSNIVITVHGARWVLDLAG